MSLKPPEALPDTPPASAVLRDSAAVTRRLAFISLTIASPSGLDGTP
jgi:hypothetical protein